MVAAVHEPAGTSITLSTKGQIVIPKELRERLGWRPGDTLTVEEHDDAIVIRLRRADRLSPEQARRSVETLRSAFARLQADATRQANPPHDDLQRRADEGAGRAWVRTPDGVLRSAGERRAKAKR